VRIVSMEKFDSNEKFDEFLKSNPTSLLFHSSRYICFLSSYLKCSNKTLIAVDDNDNLLGILPLMEMTAKYGKVINSLPFYGSHGSVITRDPKVKRLLLTEYENITSQKNILTSTYIETPFSDSEFFQNVSFPVDDIHVTTRIGQMTILPETTNLGEAENKILEMFHYKTRNMVKKAIKSNVEVVIDNNAFDFLYEVHVENMENICGQPKPKRFFDMIKTHFQADLDYKIYTASIGKERIAALLVFYFNETAEYFTPVIKHDFRNTQPLSLIIYKAMAESSLSGYRRWNWGGTWPTQESLHRFKSRFGTLDEKYHYYTKINNTEVFDLQLNEIIKEYPNFYVVPYNLLKDFNE